MSETRATSSEISLRQAAKFRGYVRRYPSNTHRGDCALMDRLVAVVICSPLQRSLPRSSGVCTRGGSAGSRWRSSAAVLSLP